ncbi:MAG: hypothetical protein ACQEQT_04280 [Chloroflexota bacterium]
MSIIDILRVSFNKVARKLWLAAIPVLLDIFFWAGPKLSIAPVVEQTIDTLRGAMEMTSPPGNLDANVAEMFEMTIEMLRSTLGRTNLFALLAWGRLGVPSIAGIEPIDPSTDWVIELSTYWQTFLAQLVIVALGLLIASAFLAMLAQETRYERVDGERLLRRTPLYWLYLGIIVLPLSILGLFVLGIGLLFGPFVIFVGVFLVWMMLYLTFIPQAVTLSEANPFQALINSFTVVRLNFWPTVGLVLLSNLINVGLGFIWARLLLGSSLGTGVAILANAYVGTATTLAFFIFYQDRFAAWHELLEQQRSQQ